jgi:glutathione peroxidase
MTLRQRIMKWIYPAIIFFSKLKKRNRILSNDKEIKSPASFYSLSVQLNNGQSIPFDQFKGKKVLLVNTASNCGYTNQYAELQKLFMHSKEDLVVIGFPANDFKEQEKGDDKEIANFCQVNYGVSFPLAKKSSVLKGSNQNEVYRWLSSKELNGWNEQEPTWNFSKYLVSEDGTLLHYFDPAVSPLGSEIINAVHH